MTDPATARRRLPPSPPKDKTLAVTWGQWGGFYRYGGKGCWRVCVGPVALTFLRAEFANVLEAWLTAQGHLPAPRAVVSRVSAYTEPK